MKLVLSTIKIDIINLKREEPPSIEENAAELIQAGGNILRLKIHELLVLFGIRKNCHSNGSSLLLYLFIVGVKKSY